MSHTPGPWKAERCERVPERGRIYIEGPLGWDKTPICSCYETDDRDENEANARLVAAAPELLAALEEMLPYAKRQIEELAAKMVGSLYPAINAAKIERASAAIAKAKGI